jgi:zinc protease
LSAASLAALSTTPLKVTGDITLDELRALAEKRFGGWERADAAVSAVGDPEGSKARLVVVDKPGAPQTALRVTAVAAARRTLDYPALQVMNAALGGLFSSRINLNLREE